jgi:putative transposase
LVSDGIKVKPVGVRGPNQNAVAERFVQSVKQECLDHFVVYGKAHLRHILSEYLAYYHQHRPIKVWPTGGWAGRSWLWQSRIDP